MAGTNSGLFDALCRRIEDFAQEEILQFCTSLVSECENNIQEYQGKGDKSPASAAVPPHMLLKVGSIAAKLKGHLEAMLNSDLLPEMRRLGEDGSRHGSGASTRQQMPANAPQRFGMQQAQDQQQQSQTVSGSGGLPQSSSQQNFVVPQQQPFSSSTTNWQASVLHHQSHDRHASNEPQSNVSQLESLQRQVLALKFQDDQQQQQQFDPIWQSRSSSLNFGRADADSMSGGIQLLDYDAHPTSRGMTSCPSTMGHSDLLSLLSDRSTVADNQVLDPFMMIDQHSVLLDQQYDQHSVWSNQMRQDGGSHPHSRTPNPAHGNHSMPTDALRFFSGDMGQPSASNAIEARSDCFSNVSGQSSEAALNAAGMVFLSGTSTAYTRQQMQGQHSPQMHGVNFINDLQGQVAVPARFNVVPTNVQLHILRLCQTYPIIRVQDFDEKVINKMAFLSDKYGSNECIKMLDQIAGRMKTKHTAMKNGPGYLDVAVSSHLDMLKTQTACPGINSIQEYARHTLTLESYHELETVIQTSSWVKWDHMDQGIIHLIKKLPEGILSSRLNDLTIRSFRNVDNIRGCIMSVLGSKRGDRGAT